MWCIIRGSSERQEVQCVTVHFCVNITNDVERGGRLAPWPIRNFWETDYLRGSVSKISVFHLRQWAWENNQIDKRGFVCECNIYSMQIFWVELIGVADLSEVSKCHRDLHKTGGSSIEVNGLRKSYHLRAVSEKKKTHHHLCAQNKTATFCQSGRRVEGHWQLYLSEPILEHNDMK